MPIIDIITDRQTVAPPPVIRPNKIIPIEPKMPLQKFGKNEKIFLIASPIIETFEPDKTTICINPTF